MSLSRKRLRRLLLAGLSFLIVAKILFLSPAPLDEGNSPRHEVDPETLVRKKEKTLAPGIPTHRIPEYAVDGFVYVSVQRGAKQWKIEADRAYLYNPERLMHSRQVTANLYDSGETPTIVTGMEAKYFLNQKDLEVFGSVKTVFPDGFEVNSEYLRYFPNTRHIQIPTGYAVQGVSHEKGGQDFRFKSNGLDYVMGEAQITLLEQAEVSLEKPKDSKLEGKSNIDGIPDLTVIQSDRCLIFRDEKLAKFSMHSKKPLSSRFVHITQPTLFTRARRADLRYGDFSQVLQYLVAFDDVLIKETGPEAKALRYGTGGRADFDTQRDLVALSQFPQAYQDDDTVTGDVILIHRNTGIVEVEHSNAFSQGSAKQ